MTQAVRPFARWKPLLAGGLAYFAIARMSTELATLHGNISPVWPATGLGIWLFIVFGVRIFPAVALGEILVNLCSGLPPTIAVEMAAGSVAEALLGLWLWTGVQARFQGALRNQCTPLCNVAAALGAPVAGASIGTLALIAGGIAPPGAAVRTWVTWWVGDALGALFVLPVLLCAPALWHWIRQAPRRELLKCALVLAAAVGVSLQAFFLSSTAGYAFGIFPVLLVASLWIEAPIAGFVALLLAALAIAGTYGGHGPFATGSLNENLVQMQIFLISAAIMGQVLPAFRGRGSLLAGAILLVGWTLSGVIFANMFKNQRQTDETNFAALTSNATKDIEEHLATYTDALRSCRSLLLASPGVGSEQWKTFVESLDIGQRYPGVNGLGVIYPVHPEETQVFLARIRAEGNPGFRLHTAYGQPVPEGKVHYVVTYVAPTVRTRNSLGLDIATDPEQRAAAKRARDSGEPQMTFSRHLIQDEQKRPGFLMYLPVYRQGAALGTAADRRAALQCWVYSAFVAQNLVQGWLSGSSETLQMNFFEGGTLNPEHLLYSNAASPSEVQAFKSVRPVKMAGLSFSLGWNPGGGYKSSSITVPVWTSLSLALGTVILAGLVRATQTFRQRAEDLVAERTLELRKEMIHREQVDRALREVSSFQTAILESASMAIISTTPEGVIRTFNPPARRMLGYTESEVVGLKSFTLFHDPAELAERAIQVGGELGCEVKAGFEACVAKACRDLPNEYECTLVRRDGSRLPVQLSVTAIRNSSGILVGFLGLAVDMSERRKTMKQIAAAQQAAEGALHELVLQRDAMDRHAIVSITDAQGRITHINDKFCTISGYSAKELLGRDHRIISSGHHPKEFWRDFRQTISSGRVWHGEVCNRAKNGSPYWIEATVVPFSDRKGVVNQFVSISSDITARIAHEAELSAARHAAESASKAKSEFLAVMSHEIRTPMNAVIGFTELLIDTPLQTQQREFVDIIRSSSQNLIALINDILDFSKIEAGKLDVERTRVDGIAVIESVAQTFSPQAKSRGLWLNLNIAPGIPRIVDADPSRLRQVIINLVGNAMKFTAQGGVTLSAGAAPSPGPAGLRFTITDTGIGIPLEKQGPLFQKFVQADSSITRQFGGTGLGLAICKRLVELMDGQIGLSSVPAQGSSFWFDLPFSADQGHTVSEPARTAPPAQAPIPADLPVAGPVGALRRVLVADDNRLNQRLVKLFLQKLGYESVIANNGAEAVDLVQSQAFDAVLMDHQMPVMDGCEAARAIRQWEAGRGDALHVPIIALTANATQNGAEIYQAAGMDGYLAKPLLLPTLGKALEALFAPKSVPSSGSGAPMSAAAAGSPSRGQALAQAGTVA